MKRTLCKLFLCLAFTSGIADTLYPHWNRDDPQQNALLQKVETFITAHTDETGHGRGLIVFEANTLVDPVQQEAFTKTLDLMQRFQDTGFGVWIIADASLFTDRLKDINTTLGYHLLPTCQKEKVTHCPIVKPENNNTAQLLEQLVQREELPVILYAGHEGDYAAMDYTLTHIPDAMGLFVAPIEHPETPWLALLQSKQCHERCWVIENPK